MSKRAAASSYAPDTNQALIARPAAPWDRLPEEDDWEYSLFLQYRDLEPRVRSVKALMAVERKTRAERPDVVPSGTLSIQVLHELAHRHDWARRSSAWDDFLRYERDQALVSAARAAGEQQASVALDALDFSQEFFDVLKQRALVQGQLKRADLNTLLKILPSAMRSAETAMRMLRLLGGESTANLAVRGSMIIAGESQVDLTRLSSEDLVATRATLTQLLHLKPPEFERALHAAGEIVEGEARELPPDA